MTKKKSSSTQQSPARRLISAVVALIVVVVAFIASLAGGGTTTTTTSPNAPTSPPSNGVTQPPVSSGNVTIIPIQQGFGAQKGFWQVFFSAPTGSRDASTYVGGIDTQLAAAINGVTRTLDIAAFEFNNPVLTQAVLDAKSRGVTVRIVTDDEHGTKDTADTSLAQFKKAGITVVDDGRSDLMHNKFMILDSTVVWTGAWNYTINDTYRNNNNAVSLRSRKVVEDYQVEFNEMFVDKQFGPRSPSNTPNVSFTQDGTPIQIYFASEDKTLVPALIATLQQARSSIKFMAFSFTLSDVGDVLLSKAASKVAVQGIFETTGSETRFSQLTPLFCAGLPVRQDGNPFVLHHKVFIIDDTTVVAGSFNFSSSARDGNDENMFIITDADLAAQYVAEFNRRWAEAKTPDSLKCS